VPAVTELLVAELLYLEKQGAQLPIEMLINSSGTTRQDGEIVSGQAGTVRAGNHLAMREWAPARTVDSRLWNDCFQINSLPCALQRLLLSVLKQWLLQNSNVAPEQWCGSVDPVHMLFSSAFCSWHLTARASP
jgi:hypothetical protein